APPAGAPAKQAASARSRMLIGPPRGYIRPRSLLMPLTSRQQELAFKALDAFAIELPSWGFANTGTRFGKFIQASAATTTAEKIADAAQVHKVTGCCPSIAVHVLWDYPNGVADVESVDACAKQ